MALRFGSADPVGTERHRRRLVAILAVLLAAIGLIVQAARAADDPDPGKRLLHFLEVEADWYRQVSTLAHGTATPEEVLLKEAVAQNAQESIQQSFLFAERQAIAMTATPAAAPTTSSGAGGAAQADRLAKLLVTATQRVTDYRSQLDQIRQQERTVSATSRPVLTARRQKLESELNLALARQDVIQRLADFAAEGTGGSLVHQVNELRRTVPDAMGGDEAEAAATTQPATVENAGAAVAAAGQEPMRLSSMGLVGLVEELFTLSHKASDLKEVANRTADIHKWLDQLRGPLSDDLKDAIHRADALAAMKESEDPNVLARQRDQIDAITERFNQLSAAAVPLRKALTYLETTQTSLKQWSDTVDSQYWRTLRHLVTRLAIMGGLIVIVLLVSQVWRRATFRYVQDVRRRRQFLFVRRVVVGGIILVIVIAGFVTEFGSLATYAGLLTAGIAVALQSVILSGVSHFFFMGRYGVRVGDRVTINGITGDVIDIGIFRMYMMELNGQPNNLQPTGRIVVFSNSVLFQPNAFYKQIPGAEYNWHELGLTLSPDSDYHLAEQKLIGAVESVYNEYKGRIEEQHDRARDLLHVQLATPQLQGRFHFVDSGLEFVVRYPVEMRRAAEIDDKVTRALLETIAHEPRLKLVATSTPKIQPAGGPASQ